MDKALCTGTFVVPVNLADGYYTFQWRWVFNSGTAAYVTCFEAYIGQDVVPVESPTLPPTIENENPAPTPPPTENEANCVSLYAQCAGGNSNPSCCSGGASCMKQSEWYSQCLMACPAGWECESTVTTGGPTGAPTVSPPSTPVPTPTITTPSPTASPTLDVCGCKTGSSILGRVRDSGNVVTQAIVTSDCACQKLCSYAIGSVVFQFDSGNGRCKCFDQFRKLQAKDNVTTWVGEVVVEDAANDL